MRLFEAAYFTAALYWRAARYAAVASPPEDKLGENGIRASLVALRKTFTQPPFLNSSVKFFNEKRSLANAAHQLKLFAGVPIVASKMSLGCAIAGGWNTPPGGIDKL